MGELGKLVQKIRTKNAGPFWLTIDIFCGEADVFARISRDLSTDQVATLFRADVAAVKRFEIADLNVVKFSLPRPVVQGRGTDRDMHGAGWAPLLEELQID